MEITVFCPCSAKVRVEVNDRLAKCPSCQRVSEVLIGPAQRVDAVRSGARVTETIIVQGQEVVLNQSQRSEISPGSLVAAIRSGGQLIGIADSSRQLWFPGPAGRPAQRPNLVWLAAPLALALAALAIWLLNPWAWVPVALLLLLAWRFPAEEQFELGWDLD
jgi:hypothetical protein